MYVFINVCMYVCMSVHIHLHTCKYTHSYLYVCVCINTEFIESDYTARLIVDHNVVISY